jgi:hypothetical protein
MLFNYKRKMKKFIEMRIVGLIILIVFILYGVYKLYGLIHGTTTTASKMIVVNDIPKEYSSLFKNVTNITYKQTHFDDKEKRNPVSDFIYDAKYAVFVTKIKTTNGLNSLPLITKQFHETKMTDDTIYSTISSGYSEFDYLLDTLTASNLFLTLDGDSVRSIIKNNVIEGYYLRNKAFSINYKKDGIVNLFMTTTESEHSLPSVLLFLLHQKSLYFICISVLDPNDTFNMNIINKLIWIPPLARVSAAGKADGNTPLSREYLRLAKQVEILVRR